MTLDGAIHTTGIGATISVKTRVGGDFTLGGSGAISSGGPITIDAAGDMTLNGAVTGTGTGDAGMVALTASGGSVYVAGAVTAPTLEVAARNDIVIAGAASLDQLEDIAFVVGRTMTCADGITLHAGATIAIRPFDPPQTIYVAAANAPMTGGVVSIPQETFDRLDAPRVVVGGRDKTGAMRARGEIYIGSLAFAGDALEIATENYVVATSSGASAGGAGASITGSGSITLTGDIRGEAGASFAIDNRGGNGTERSAGIHGSIELDGDFTYQGELLVFGTTGSGEDPTVRARGILFDAPRVNGDVVFDGDVRFEQNTIEFAGRIVNKNTISAGAGQQLFFNGNYTGESGSLLAGTGEDTELHFQKDAEFRGDPPGRYGDANGSWLVFSGAGIQRFDSGGNAFGNIRIDKTGGELRLAGSDMAQRGDAVLELANGLLNLACEPDPGGAGRRGWALGAPEPARDGNFVGGGGTLRLANSLGAGATVRAMDISLGEQCAVTANSAGHNVIAAMGNIVIGKNNKDFGASSVAMIPGSAAERTSIASEAVLFRLVVARPAKLVGNIALVEMQLGDPNHTSGISLDGGSSTIRVLGNWTNYSADVDGDGVSRAFVYGAGTVIFDRTSNADKAIAIRGGSAWHTLVCESPGAVIRFDNYPRRHYVANKLQLAGSAGGFITLTRLNDTGRPALMNTTRPVLPLTEEDHKNYWDFVMRSGISGSGGTTVDLEHTIVAYSNANLRIPIPPKEKAVLASPFYSDSNPFPPGVYPGADYEHCSYYNINWVARHGFVYAFTEDSDGNGRIDRIRAQAVYELNSGASGAFDAFSVRVMKNDRTAEEWIRVKGYGAVPGSPDSIYIYLEEHDYADGSAVNLAIDIARNASLTDLATGLRPVATSDHGDGLLRTTDTVLPRVSYALMLPQSNEGFVQFSEDIHALDDGSPRFVYPGNRVPAAALPVDSDRNSEFVLSFDEAGYGVQELAAGPLFTVTGLLDGAAPARDKHEEDPDYPSPRYPVDWTYSGYVAVPGNPPDISRSYRLFPGDLGVPSSGSALVPPNALPGGIVSHRVTDLLAANGAGNHFATPVWAMNTQLTVGAGQGAHVVRSFSGGDYLEDKDITLEVNVHADLKDGYTPELLFGSAIPASAKAGSAVVDPDFGTPHGNAGLWLPDFASRAFEAGRENVYAFSNLVAQPYPSAFFVGAPDAAGSGVFDFKLKKNAPDYAYAGVSMLEFFLRLVPKGGDDPAVRGLYIGRLGRGSPWYRHMEPFKFELHTITRQRGGVTILNNVIKPSAGESVYVEYTLPRSGPVTIQVFTLDGNMVKVLDRSSKAAGQYRVGWDGRNNGGREVARGMYFIRVVAPDIDEIRKVMVAR